MRFKAPVLIGHTITIETVVTAKEDTKSRIFVLTTCTRDDGVIAVEGEAELFFF
jgi:3-hydroxybutyryl-CoA dehydratase